MLVVSNPVDVLTYLAAQRLNLPPSQVIGLGTQLDTIRFRSLIAEQLQAAADAGQGPDPRRARRQHGADLVERHGRPACRWRNIPAGRRNVADELFTRTKGSGAEVIKKKGGAGFAVGMAIREVIHAIALDRRRVLPVSSVQNGCYDIRDVASQRADGRRPRRRGRPRMRSSCGRRKMQGAAAKRPDVAARRWTRC